MIEVVAVLILLMIVAALFVVETSNLLFSVVSVGAVGFLAAIAFVFLGAPDVAIVQIGVEVISLVVLLRAKIGRGEDDAPGGRGLVATVAAVTLIVTTSLFGVRALRDFPAFGAPVMERVAGSPSTAYLEIGLAETGVPNIVTAVLLDFRAYDTLGEATVLFCAILGALAVLRRHTRTVDSASEEEADEDE